MAPRDIPHVGRFAMIADPQGAMLAMITYCDKE
jgi:predicted enzyme related to lactoylglutathione lyase